mgnify:CR=1 FL=1
MALLASMTLACSKHSSCTKEKDGTAPITKPQITIEGDRLTPEALWAMGRIGTVALDVETGHVAYTVSYYSVTENRSTTWIRLCTETENGLEPYDEFIGSDPAWFGNSGVLAYLKGGKLYLRQHQKDIAVTGYDKNIEGFLFCPMRDKILLISAVKTRQT